MLTPTLTSQMACVTDAENSFCPHDCEIINYVVVLGTMATQSDDAGYFIPVDIQTLVVPCLGRKTRQQWDEWLKGWYSAGYRLLDDPLLLDLNAL